MANYYLGSAAVAIVLSSGGELTLDYPGGQPSGNWVLEAGNEAVVQTVNAEPSFYLNNLNQTSYSIEGTWAVQTTGDDDMGFLVGYQNSSHFYRFDWEQGTQGYTGQTAAEGMSIKNMTGGVLVPEPSALLLLGLSLAALGWRQRK